MENVEVGPGAVICRAIIDKDVVVPPACQIGIDPERDRHRFTITEKEIVVIPKGMPIEP